MTPEQAERLRDLFFEARATTREAATHPATEAYAADDAAVEAFNTALKEATVR